MSKTQVGLPAARQKNMSKKEAAQGIRADAPFQKEGEIGIILVHHFIIL